MVGLPENFWGVICEFEPLWYFMFVLNVVLLVFLALSVLFVTPGSSSFYMVIISGAIGVPLVVVLGVLLRTCAT